MQSLKLGPFAFSFSMILLVMVVVLTFFIANRIARKSGITVEPALWLILVTSMVASRLTFVVMYRDVYLSAPWSIFDIRDGGFSTFVAVGSAIAMTATLAYYQRAWRKALLVSMATGVTIWFGVSTIVAALTQAQGLPQLALSSLDGKKVEITSFGGKPVVVNLWATWCPPCRREMPVLRDAQQANRDIVFVFANQGETPETVQRYLDADKLAMENVLLDMMGDLPRKLGSIALPTTFFFDKNGKLVDTRVGEVSAATLQQRMDAMRAAQ